MINFGYLREEENKKDHLEKNMGSPGVHRIICADSNTLISVRWDMNRNFMKIF